MDRFLLIFANVMIPKSFLGGLLGTIAAFILLTIGAHIASFYDFITLGTVVQIMTIGFIWFALDFIVFGLIGLYGMRWYRNRKTTRV
ncbi:MAG: hypothetical protein EOP84_19425 [Verrucomicrobiaceae bacterium]|nr:MAG: hypothetical protein EOP84_19425 [Verrucomicrobiaceae bacterium]